MRWKWGWNGSDIDIQHARAAFEVPRRRRPDGAGAGDRAEPAARPGAGPPLLAFPRADRRSRSGRRDRADQGGRQVRRRTRTRPRCVRRPDDRRRAPPSSSAARFGRDGDVRRGRRVARGLRVRARAQRDPVGVAGRVPIAHTTRAPGRRPPVLPRPHAAGHRGSARALAGTGLEDALDGALEASQRARGAMTTGHCAVRDAAIRCGQGERAAVSLSRR